MSASGGDKSVTDKVKDVADKVDEKLEPDADKSTAATSGASDPFDSARRADEASTSDTPAGGIE